jgi:hypothetical protein
MFIRKKPGVHSILVLMAALLLFGLSSSVLAQGNNPLITVNETGNGTLLFPGSPIIPTNGVPQADPGPGGLPNALTYNLLGPPSLVAGDLMLIEPPTGALSDIIRFNPAGTASGYPASLVFYSDIEPGELPNLADIGFPVSRYTNIVTFMELGPEGDNGFVYTPTANQPGFVPGFSVTYDIISDAPAPEPTTALLVLPAMGLIWLRLRGRKVR